MHQFCEQIRMLTKKNIKIFIQKKFNIGLIIFVPCYIFLLLFFFSYQLNITKSKSKNLNPESQHIKKIPKCIKPQDCVTLGYFVLGEEEPWIQDVMQELSDNNDLEYGKDVKMLLQTQDQQELLDYPYQHRNQTQIAVVFCNTQWMIKFQKFSLEVPCNFEKLDEKLIYYSIFYNQTLGFKSPYFFRLQGNFPVNEYVIQTKKALDQAIISTQSDKDSYTLDIQTKSFPVLENYFMQKFDFISSGGSFLFFIPIAISFMIILSEMISEKFKGLKLFLTVSGLSSCAHLTSWTIFSLFSSFLFSLLTFIVINLVDSEFISNVFKLFWLIYFFTIAFSMNSLAILINSIATSGKAGLNFAYGFLLFGFIFQSLMAGPNSVNYFYSGKTLSGTLETIFSFYPGYNYIKIYSDLVYFSGSRFDANQKVYIKGQRLQLNQIFSSYTKSSFIQDLQMYSIFHSFVLIFRNIIIYYILAYIAENTLQSNIGVPLKIFRKKKFIKKNETQKQKVHESLKQEEQDIEDLILEKNNDDKVIVQRINKVYSRGIGCFQKNQQALNDVSFYFQRGQILGVLGKNGAGKTTLINIITGYLDKDMGKAQIFGDKLDKNLDHIRKIVSLCPQHDIYWDELSIRQHLEIFQSLKSKENNMKKQQEIVELLSMVNLLEKSDQKIKYLSGGMKRRLSIAISSIGDPQLIIYDEPTTGLDPIRTHEILELLKKLKQKKGIILTTHSMEEADELCDKIVIIKKGEVQCIGSPQQLKEEFSNNYEVTIIAKTEQLAQQLKEVLKKENQFEIQNSYGLKIKLHIKKIEMSQSLQTLKSYIGKDSRFENDIVDWGIEKQNLENVFFNLHQYQSKSQINQLQFQ